MRSSQIRVAVIEEDYSVRLSLETVITSQIDMNLLGVVSSVNEAIKSSLFEQVDVLILDLSCEDRIREVKREINDAAIIVSICGNSSCLQLESLSKQVNSCFLRTSPIGEILNEIRDVYNEKLYFDCEVLRTTLDNDETVNEPKLQKILC